MREVLGSYRVAVETAVIVVLLVGLRALLWVIGVTGMSTTPLISSVISGGIFVMGLVLAGTLVDYRDAERAPTDIAASLYALLRETEAMNRIWGKPDMVAARARLISVVTSMRADITNGATRECQAAIEDLSQTLEELEEFDVPANYIVRLRSEHAALRKAALRVYHIQREEFLPSAKAMITSVVAVIMLILLFTDMGGRPAGVTGDGRFPGLLFHLPAAAADRHRQALQGRPRAHRRRCQPVSAHRVCGSCPDGGRRSVATGRARRQGGRARGATDRGRAGTRRGRGGRGGGSPRRGCPAGRGRCTARNALAPNGGSSLVAGKELAT